MSFIIDKQTLQDLNISGKYKRDSIFSLYNKTETFGGELLLEKLFQQPFTNPEAIDRQAALISFFRSLQHIFQINADDLDIAQSFTNSYSNQDFASTLVHASRRKLLAILGLNEEKKHLEFGIRATLRIMLHLADYLSELAQQDKTDLLRESIFDQAWLREEYAQLVQLQYKIESYAEGIPLGLAARCDYQLRHKWSKEIQQSLSAIYHIDLYQSIASVANERGFVRAEVLAAEHQHILLENVYHPTIPNAVGNDLAFDGDHNLIFLTGANMAGKSTYMKSFGIAIYLAHLGLPVPANKMLFSVKDGLYSSINVSDDIDMGHSHYYAEVLRVKKVAEYVNQAKDMVVIFDELFKGTNVKDAFEATLTVTRAFQQHHNCQYLISTHIVEVGQQLQEKDGAVQFVYMPTQMRGQAPYYSYRSEKGISSDKHGMVLIHKEKVLELLEQNSKNV
ncbi:MutS-related protein [Sphingobacterium sp.]|uniref:MutS-related protein n=1 Tax=Sphingobacterium sp. TaxID=341027 RepID=UPI0028A1A39E|nr:DNA mismatch repair protein [Sphingobacterium sp.]